MGNNRFIIHSNNFVKELTPPKIACASSKQRTPPKKRTLPRKRYFFAKIYYEISVSRLKVGGITFLPSPLLLLKNNFVDARTLGM